MTFAEVEEACRKLREELEKDTGIEVVGMVSVEKPSPPEDELHFLRLVSWMYVFLIEVAPVPIRHIQSLLRGTSPREHGKIAELQRLVRSMRTYQAHQLSETSTSDAATKIFVANWLSINSGTKPWTTRSRVLCSMFVGAIASVLARWMELTKNGETRSNAVTALLDAVDRQWPAHLFDRMLEDAAADLGLVGMDYPVYRGMRIEGWKKLTECFSTREDAEAALRRAIRADLISSFGGSSTEASA